MKIGVFGGTFDPPHLGHLILSAEAKDQLQLDRLLWVLTPDPPHKQGQEITGLAKRLSLVHAAIDDNPAFELSTVDIDRPGPHYAVDTVRFLSQIYPSADIFYLIGGDSLHDLPDWYHPHELVQVVSGLGVMRRPGDAIDLSGLERQLPGITARIRFIQAPLMEISSSEIRSRIRNGRPYRYYLPEKLFQLIEKNHIYQG